MYDSVQMEKLTLRQKPGQWELEDIRIENIQNETDKKFKQLKTLHCSCSKMIKTTKTNCI